MHDTTGWSTWQRFWHEPVRAERLALTRILLAFFLLLDQLIQYWPQFAMFYGPEGVAPAGTHDEWCLQTWRWTVLFFNTDDLTFLTIMFWLRAALTVGLLVGWHTRLMNVGVWFLTLCFINRNPALKNGADDVLMVGLFLLMLSPSGRAFSLDAWSERRKLPRELAVEPFYTPAWSVRVLQIQVCVLYMTTGLAKLVRVIWDGDLPDDGIWRFHGTWWEGSSIHYVLCDTTMSRFSYAQLPIPYWVTVVATYVSVWWETLFPFLVLWRRTRKWALWFGVLFHLGIFLTIEIGWFSFYTVSLYGVFVPGEWWDRWRRRPATAQERSEPLAAGSVLGIKQ
ncbi:MAG: HTTM domain-containing protein [Gemmataceae bacterium]|nr:HTTM domain-containing protein [Gemmataceae bacterium]MCI0737659.1 HTTM domain-containing protein [Gemmataceae bacterium]